MVDEAEQAKLILADEWCWECNAKLYSNGCKHIKSFYDAYLKPMMDVLKPIMDIIDNDKT